MRRQPASGARTVDGFAAALVVAGLAVTGLAVAGLAVAACGGAPSPTPFPSGTGAVVPPATSTPATRSSPVEGIVVAVDSAGKERPVVERGRFVI